MQDTYRAAEQALFDAYGVQVLEHVVDVPEPGSSIRVLEVGEGDPVLFIHGSPNDAATWIPLAAQMKGNRCLMMERPGAGLSEPVSRWSDHRSESADFVRAVADHFSIDTVDIVGSSFGGLYAYNFALRFPERIGRIVQMGAPAGPSVLGMPKIFRLISAPIPIAMLKRGLRGDASKAREMFGEIGHKTSVELGRIPDVVFEWYAALLSHTHTAEHVAREVRAIATPFGYKSSAKISGGELAGLSAPVLYLWGDNDIFAKPQQADALCALTPGAEIEHFDGFGHVLWFDAPELIAERLRAFLSVKVS